ncbi:GDSL-type esterase/lipase family protein [Kribbella sp. NBC_01245]|uniref:GDSL-type esterase/lipase family protein n=1 Tax=Kribbella sp. NBC_01245 TaxID=2903578 RepID=UPI002E2CE2C5|nr:GDSL-type esterase/lipase family protein [Kribbella sp. NBC_01245]
MGKYARLCVAALAAVVVLVGSTPALAGPSDSDRYYLSLGDSLAFGFQGPKVDAGLPLNAFETGYSHVLAGRLEHGGRPLTLVNYGCPGESTTTFTAGPCPWKTAGRPLHDPFVGSQEEAALAFLRGHRGKVDVITLSLWGNDANAFVASCNGNLQCIIDGAPAAIAAIASNLSRTLAHIRQAAPDARVVVLGAYNANIGTFPLTHPIIRQLNLALADAAATNRAAFANPFPTFNPDGDTGAALCTLTLICTHADGHPSDTGYLAIAALLHNQLAN